MESTTGIESMAYVALPDRRGNRVGNRPFSASVPRTRSEYREACSATRAMRPPVREGGSRESPSQEHFQFLATAAAFDPARVAQIIGFDRSAERVLPRHKAASRFFHI